MKVKLLASVTSANKPETIDTAKEEDILASPAFHKEGTALTHLIWSCLIDKTINSEDLIRLELLKLRERWESLNIDFALGPYIRYEDQPGSQATMFVKDPCGNHLEFKSFKDESGIFDTKW